MPTTTFRSALLSLLVPLALASFATACGGRSVLTDGGLGSTDGAQKDGADGGGRDGSGPRALEGIDITPAVATIAQSTSVDLRATARFADGTTSDVTATASWSTSSPMVVALMGATARGVAPGKATITAAYMGQSGMASVSVTTATLKSITVDPAGLVLPVNAKASYTATGLFSDGSKQNLTTQVMWTSSNAAVASITTGAPAGGVALGIKPGTTTIAAALLGVTGQTGLTVTSATLKAIEITPPNPVLPVKVTQAFKATGIYNDGTTTDLTTSVAWSSSDTSVLDVSTIAPTQGEGRTLAPGTSILSAAFAGATGTTSVTVKAATLTAIKVSPPSATVDIAGTQAFTASGTYSDSSTADLTASVAWSSSDAAVASVSNASGAKGQATGLAPGTVTVTASLSGVSGTAKLTVSAAQVVSILVSPKSVTLAVGAKAALQATATFSDMSSRDVTTEATWSSTDPRTADVSNASGTAGVVTGRNPGKTVVSALYGGRGDSANVAVTNATLSSIVVSPAVATLAATGTQAFTARGNYSDGTSIDVTTQATWSTDDAAVATISNASGSKGLATATGAGKTQVRATLDGREGTATIVVTESALATLAILPSNPSRHVGERAQFAALGGYVDGTGKNLTTVATWSSSNPAVATISTSGMNIGQARCVAAGTVTISATYMGISATTTLTCTDPDLVDLQVTPFTASAVQGGFVLFTATAVYSDASTRDVSNSATWGTSDPAVAVMVSMGPRSGIASAAGAGTATIKATYMGLSGTATLTVTDATLLSLQVTPINPTIKVGQTQQFQAVGIYSDGSNRNVTFQATWTSSNTAVADISNAMGGPGPGGGMSRGQATGFTAGTTTITATFGGSSDATTLTVTDAKIVSLNVSPITASLKVDEDQQYQAVAIYDDGTNANVTFQATWTSSDADVADVSNGFMSKGVATGIAAGTTTITASYKGLQGSGTLTVVKATLVDVQVTPTNATLQKGTMQMYQAVAIYSDGSSRNVTFDATWASTDTRIAAASNGFGSKGLVTAVAAGTAKITATFDGFTGATPVTVTDATLLEIQVTPTNPTLAKGALQNMTATALYSDFTTKNVTADATWTSSDGAIVSVSNAFGSKGRITALGAGSATVTATWMGVAGSTDVTVTGAALKEIQITPVTPSTPVGLQVRFQAVAVYTDDTTDMINAAATWTSSDTAVASISNAMGSHGLATAVAPGTTTITATYMGASGSTTYTVGSQKLLSITVSPDGITMPNGTSLPFTASGLYDDMSSFDLTNLATWISTVGSVAAVSNADGSHGLVTAKAVGDTTIEAHFDGVTGGAALGVTN